MIITTCDRCGDTINEQIESYHSLILISDGAMGIPKLIFSDKNDKPTINLVGQYCNDCSQDLHTYKIKRALRKPKESPEL
jgi:hypothetical protein